VELADELALAATWLFGGWLLFKAAFPRGRVGRLLGRWLRLVGRPRPRPFTGRASIIDGDTIAVGNARVRLFGMDAPELSQPGGAAARGHLIRLAGGREVSVHPLDVDCYGRIVARVRLDTVDLSKRMVEEGFAVAMTDWHLDFAFAEWRARRRGLGLWAKHAGGISDPAAHRRAVARRSRRPG
jgi:endonuclease YncB( thermonuclease family)